MLFFDAKTRHQLHSFEKKHYENLIRFYGHFFVQAPAKTEADEFLLPYANNNKIPIISNDTFKKYESNHNFDWMRENNTLYQGMVIQNTINIPRIDCLNIIISDDIEDYINKITVLIKQKRKNKYIQCCKIEETRIFSTNVIQLIKSIKIDYKKGLEYIGHTLPSDDQATDDYELSYINILKIMCNLIASIDVAYDVLNNKIAIKSVILMTNAEEHIDEKSQIIENISFLIRIPTDKLITDLMLFTREPALCPWPIAFSRAIPGSPFYGLHKFKIPH